MNGINYITFKFYLEPMKSLCIILTIFGCSFFTIWQPDFETAQKIATEKNQLILLNFSGSDWCGPCIRMKKEYFYNEVFSAMADSHLVMVNADFPRSKKNQLSKMKQQQNDALAEKYNPEGRFPFTLILNSAGKIIKTWDGLPAENVEDFTNSIKAICDEKH